MYSFTKPLKKNYFKEDTKLWLIFYTISLFLYISFSLFLLIKAYFYTKDYKNYNKNIITLNKKISILNSKKKMINLQKSVYEDISVKNSLIKDSIKNLLDLVPDPITLNKFLLQKNSLIIYGITPTKDVYNLLMLPPLESIFSNTKTFFYQMPNGWFRFKSINTLKGRDETAF